MNDTIVRSSKAVFLDRDGIINRVVFRGSSKPIAPWTIDEFTFETDINMPLNEIKNSGYYLFVVTNQPDLSKGLVSPEVVTLFHKRISDELPIDEISVCPHIDEHNCFCRKPKPGMILALAKKYNIDLKSSYMVGDTWKDISAGSAAGCKTVLIKRPYNSEVKAEIIINRLGHLITIIKNEDKKSKKQ